MESKIGKFGVGGDDCALTDNCFEIDNQLEICTCAVAGFQGDDFGQIQSCKMNNRSFDSTHVFAK
jgi:hypothetical protein